MSYIATNLGQFTYFDTILGHPVWEEKRILDFGGNVGNILLDPSTINPNNYWCIDVSKDAIDEGQSRHPQAHFMFYDRYQSEFNPTGVKNLSLPNFECKFDYILSVSAIGTNLPRTEMLQFVPNLIRFLRENGMLAFTFVHPSYVPMGETQTNLEHYAIATYFEQLPADKRGRLWYTVTSNAIYVENDSLDERDINESGFLVLYTPDYIKLLFPAAEITAPVSPLTRSHCCILRKA